MGGRGSALCNGAFSVTSLVVAAGLLGFVVAAGLLGFVLTVLNSWGALREACDFALELLFLLSHARRQFPALLPETLPLLLKIPQFLLQTPQTRGRCCRALGTEGIGWTTRVLRLLAFAGGVNCCDRKRVSDRDRIWKSCPCRLPVQT